MHYSIGIDIGTTNVKCVLFQNGPVVVAEASREYATKIPRSSWAEQNPEDWWNGVVSSIHELLKISGVPPADIKVIAVSCQAPTVLPVDKQGKPLHDALIWMDRRSQEECDILADRVGRDRIFEITGNRLDSYFCLSELMWFMRKKPSLMDNCYKLLQVNGYINMKLCGVFSIDDSHATLTQLYDIHQRCWSSELFRAIGADISMMPDVYSCDQALGTISQEAADLTGLSKNTVVLAGTVDATATSLEVAVTRSGRAAEMTGTSSVVIIGYDKLVTSRELSSYQGIKPNYTLLFGAMNTAGGSLKWFRDTLYGGETPQKDAYEHMNLEIEQDAKEPSGIIFLPYMNGERSPIWDPNARGTFIGLDLNTNRAMCMRSIMEGACFALQDNLEQAYKAGINIDKLICCGGCSKSDIWLKIKASIIRKEIQIPRVNLGAPGGLGIMMAAYMGEFSSAEEASESRFEIARTIEPVREWENMYTEMFHIYKDSYRSLKEQYKALAKL